MDSHGVVNELFNEYKKHENIINWVDINKLVTYFESA